MKNFYISTAIHYVNSVPHMGHALENVLADSIHRYQLEQGKDSFFSTGTDEHGVKVYNSAMAANTDTQQFCDDNAEVFEELTNLLDMKVSRFVRTSDQKKHWPSVIKLWKKLEEKGDIYKKSYSGNYCVGCERYIPDKDLNDSGECPIHLKAPELIEEENYFFRLSKYSDLILEKIKSDELEIVPEFRRNEILNLLEGDGLKDVSFSRPKDNLPWGVPVPSDESHNMYVWCDALTNYISTLDYANEGKEYQKYWVNADKVHVIGKDIVRFHAGIWIGMLIAAEIPLPNKILIHGFLTSEGKKMSKSLNNVVDPIAEIEKYGVDALRFFFLSDVPLGQDADFSRKRFEEMYTAKLANNLGNLINRVYVLSEKNNISPQDFTDSKYQALFESTSAECVQKRNLAMDNFDTSKAMSAIFELLDFANKQMDEHKPWIMVKEDFDEFKLLMPNFINLSRQIAHLLEPFLPSPAKKIRQVLGLKDSYTLNEKFSWTVPADWKNLGEKEILFPRLD